MDNEKTFEIVASVMKEISDFLNVDTGLSGKVKQIAEIVKKDPYEEFKETVSKKLKEILEREKANDDVIKMLKDMFHNEKIFSKSILIKSISNPKKQADKVFGYYFEELDRKYDPAAEIFISMYNVIVDAFYNNMDKLADSKMIGAEALRIVAELPKKADAADEKLDTIVEKLNEDPLYAYIEGKNLPMISASQSAFSFLHPAIKFHGREHELDLIDKFISTDRPVAVQAITGVGGVGKSKLARHIAGIYKNKGFYVLWIDSRDDALIEAINGNKVKSTKPILFICDYADSKSEMMYKIIGLCANKGIRARFLLIERSGEWYKRFMNNECDGSLDDKRNAGGAYFEPDPLDLDERSLSDDAYKVILSDFAEHHFPKAPFPMRTRISS